VLYHLLVPLAEYNIIFNLFRFQTFRAAGAVVTAFLVAFWFGPAVISRLRMLKVGQVVRTEGPQDAPGEERHAHHGRGADHPRHGDPGAPLGAARQPVHA
jgi:hypothetical protein